MCKIGNRLYSAAARLLETARFVGVVLVGCSALLTGCVNDDESYDERQKAVVQLSVGADAAGQTGDQTTGDLTAEESKLYSLRVYAFVGGRLAGHYFTDNVTMQEGKHTFYMDLTLYTTGTQTVNFYVIANEKAVTLRYLQGSETSDIYTLSETTSESIINEIWFSDFIFPDVPTKGLLMYNQKSVDLSFADISDKTAPAGSGHEGHSLLNQNQKIEFALIRPMGKVNLFVAKPKGEQGTLRVKGLQIVGRGIPGGNYLMQKSEETLKAIIHREDDVDIEVVQNAELNDYLAVTSEIDANATTDVRSNPANYTLVSAHPYYAYENPFSNGGSWDVEGPDQKGFALRVKYDYDDGYESTTHSREIFLPKIERNHYYAVCCLIKNDGEIFITYNVKPWEEGDVYNMEFMYPTYHNPIVPVVSSSGTEEVNGKYPQPKIWVDPGNEKASVTFMFEIKGPVEMPWTPRLQEMGATSEDYTVEVFQYRQEGENRVKVKKTGSELIPDPENPFYITVTANNRERVGRVVGLGIAYSNRWDPDYKTPLLLINGLTGKWAYEGSQYAEYIPILQVENPTAQATEQQ